MPTCRFFHSTLMRLCVFHLKTSMSEWTEPQQQQQEDEEDEENEENCECIVYTHWRNLCKNKHA